MIKTSTKATVLYALLALSITSYSSIAEDSLGPVTSKDVVYQILTDRFYDGDINNNTPSGSP